MSGAVEKLRFSGTVTAVQPRIRLLRSFDESSHSYLGYAVTLQGELEDFEAGSISIGIGKGAQAALQLQVGDTITGLCLPVPDPCREPVAYYRVSKLQRTAAAAPAGIPPPWETVPPELEVYRQRGHRRLSARSYHTKCSGCIWAAKMAVEIIIDNWDRYGRREYRYETFCYGPLSCNRYRAGLKRQVRGRGGVVYVEEDWVDEQMTAHRAPDE